MRNRLRNRREAADSLFPREDGGRAWPTSWRRRACTSRRTPRTSGTHSSGSWPSRRRLASCPRRKRRASLGLSCWWVSTSSTTVLFTIRIPSRDRTNRANRIPCPFRAAEMGAGMRFPSVAMCIRAWGSRLRCSSTRLSTVSSRVFNSSDGGSRRSWAPPSSSSSSSAGRAWAGRGWPRPGGGSMAGAACPGFGLPWSPLSCDTVEGTEAKPRGATCVSRGASKNVFLIAKG
mmetsp:Transcript_101875/g.233279  ORF Transcript_101875/g.233279 Transcript_101875/m.233279 type:complete len:232 (-) Transcript_101875:261-956(-)